MTDRYNSFTVVLDHNIREDDAQSLMDAIRHFTNVISVEGNVSDINDYVAETRVRYEIRQKLFEALDSKI